MSDPHHFLIVGGPETGRQIRMASVSITVGRDSKNDVNLEDPLVSRHHCCFAFVNGALTVTDLGSSNETALNGQPVREARLKVGDCVTLGDTILRVVCVGPPAGGRAGTPGRWKKRLAYGCLAALAAGGLAVVLSVVFRGAAPSRLVSHLTDRADRSGRAGVATNVPGLPLEEEPLVVGAGSAEEPGESAGTPDAAGADTNAPPDSLAPPQDSPADSGTNSVDVLDRLREVHARETARIDGRSAEQKLQWANAYLDALNSLKDSFQEAGDFEGAMAVDREIQRFQSQHTLVPTDIAETAPPSLSALQRKAGHRRLDIQANRDRQVATLRTQYQRCLVNLRAELTRSGELDKAVRVDRELAQFAAQPQRQASDQ
jgi:hypothetical protein